MERVIRKSVVQNSRSTGAIETVEGEPWSIPLGPVPAPVAPRVTAWIGKHSVATVILGILGTLTLGAVVWPLLLVVCVVVILGFIVAVVRRVPVARINQRTERIDRLRFDIASIDEYQRDVEAGKFDQLLRQEIERG